MFRSVVLLTVVAASSVYGQKAPAKEKIVLRSGEVIRCHVGRGCTEETEGDRRYLVMDVDGFVVKAALRQEAKVSLADVQVTNDTEGRMQIKPTDFRLEVSGTKYRRLAALDPVAMHRLMDEAPKPQQHIGNGLPDAAYWSSPQHMRDREALKAVSASKASLLQPGEIGPHQTAAGRVYFERPPGSTDVSLIMPFQGGAILEFPFLYAPPSKHKKRLTDVDGHAGVD